MEPFVKDDGKERHRFKNLEPKHVRGAPPSLKLYDEDGALRDHLNIEKWDTDTLIEFLGERLEQ